MAARLDALRGPVPARSHDARTIAALTVNPGCSRRAILDAAGVDKRRLAERVGAPARFGQSPFAITRGLMFEKQVKADGCAPLLDLLRTELGFDVPEHEYVDLGAEPASAPGAAGSAASEAGHDRGGRHRRTRELFERVLAGAAVVADHPLLTLDVAGRTAYVEPDVVALRARRVTSPVGSASGSDASGSGVSTVEADGDSAVRGDALLYIAEVKSFSVIDGQADPAKVGAAATQAAVYVLALRRLLVSLGADPDLVASDVVLVCPKDFSNNPTAHLVDVRRQLAAVSRQLDRLPRIEALVAGLDPAIDLDLAVDQPADKQEAARPHRSAAELTKSLALIEARYAPECVTRCELAFHCRAEARDAGSADALGRAVRDALGGIGAIDDVLALAAGDTPAGPPAAPSAGAAQPGRDEAARLLRAAARAYDEALAMPPRVLEPAVSTNDFAASDTGHRSSQPTAGPPSLVAPRASDESRRDSAVVPGESDGSDASTPAPARSKTEPAAASVPEAST